MAVFDPETRRIVLRIVYDGPGYAGKTTNLRALERSFTRSRRSDLQTHGEIRGRTQFFDWMQLDGGLVRGVPLRCQLLTVPGQRMLRGRRARLLREADAVVFVCASTELGVQCAWRMLDVLQAERDRSTALPERPMIVQANKQDLPNAVSPEQVRERLELSADVPVQPARAAEGIGVRETLVLAIRAAADRVQRHLAAHGVGAIEGSAARPEDVLDELRRVPEDRGPHCVSVSLPAPRFDGDEPRAPVGTWTEAAPEPAARPNIPTGPPAPPWPDAGAPSGLIWPAVRGREVLRALHSGGEPVLHADLHARHGRSDEVGCSDLLLFELGGLCLKTSSRRRFGDVDEARQRLLVMARRKGSLGALLVPDTVVCVAVGPGGDAWLWTVSPWLTTLRSRMERAAALGDEEALGDALAAFADAAMQSLRLAVRRGVVLDVHPSNFAFFEGALRYVDDDIVEGGDLASIGHAIVRRAQEYSRHRWAVERYVERLRQASRELSSEAGAARVLRDSLCALPGRTEETARVAARILDVLDGEDGR